MPKILVMDDDKNMALSLQKILEKEGHQIEICENIHKALESVFQTDFDAIVADIFMPEGSGLEFLEKIHEKLVTAPMIVITGYPSHETAAQALRLGAFDYLTKPISTELLCKTLNNALKIYSLEKENKKYQENLEDIIKERTKELEESEERFRNLVESSKDAMVAIDEKGIVILFNPAAEKMFQRTKEEMIGTTLDLLLPEDYRKIHQDYVNSYFTTGFPDTAIGKTIELQAVRKNGIFFPMELSLSKGTYCNKKFVLGSIRDLTEKKGKEEQKRLQDSHLFRIQKLDEFSNLMGRLAHSLNNLLSPIMGYTELLLIESSGKQPAYGYSCEIMKSTEKASELMKKFLAFGSSQPLQFRTVSLNQIIQGFRQILRRSLKTSIEIEFQLVPDICNIKADVSQLEHVLLNLASNAQDAMPYGGTLRISTQKISIKKEISCDYIRMIVEDTGSGMDNSILENLFHPYFTTKKDCIGMGLPIVYGIIKQHTGEIFVTSQPGKGSQFFIDFPEIKEEEIIEEKADKTSSKESETIMVVEDDDTVRMLVCEMLQKEKYYVIEAKNSIYCLDILNSTKKHIDLLLVDVIMQPMNGIALYENLKKRFSDLKVLSISGYSAETLRFQNILKEGIPFLAKPFTSKILLDKVREILHPYPHTVEKG